VLRWADWARVQIAEWADTGDPGAWDTRAVLRDLAESGRAEASRRSMSPPTRP